VTLAVRIPVLDSVVQLSQTHNLPFLLLTVKYCIFLPKNMASKNKCSDITAKIAQKSNNCRTENWHA
jgi:hypothetical protein